MNFLISLCQSLLTIKTMRRFFRIVPGLRPGFGLRTYTVETKTKLADRARELTKKHNRIETIEELRPITDHILSLPTTGRKRNYVNIHPITVQKERDYKLSQNDYKPPESDQPHTFFIDLIPDHIEYLESEGFNVVQAINPADEDDPQKKKTNPKYPHHSINW